MGLRVQCVWKERLRGLNVCSVRFRRPDFKLLLRDVFKFLLMSFELH